MDRSIKFSGPGIANAKIIVAPTTEDGRSIIEFDATLGYSHSDVRSSGGRATLVSSNSWSGSTPRFAALARTAS